MARSASMLLFYTSVFCNYYYVTSCLHRSISLHWLKSSSCFLVIVEIILYGLTNTVNAICQQKAEYGSERRLDGENQLFSAKLHNTLVKYGNHTLNTFFALFFAYFIIAQTVLLLWLLSGFLSVLFNSIFCCQAFHFRSRLHTTLYLWA